MHIFISSYHMTNFSSHLLGSQYRYWGSLFIALPRVEIVHYYLTIQIWKQFIGIEFLPPVNHDIHRKIMTSKGPSHALLRSQVLLANVQEAHHACWAVKIQMAGSRWVINAMLSLLKCMQLPHTDQTPGTNQLWENPGHVGYQDCLSLKTCFYNIESEERIFSVVGIKLA